MWLTSFCLITRNLCILSLNTAAKTVYHPTDSAQLPQRETPGITIEGGSVETHRRTALVRKASLTGCGWPAGDSAQLSGPITYNGTENVPPGIYPLCLLDSSSGGKMGICVVTGIFQRPRLSTRMEHVRPCGELEICGADRLG